MKKIISIFDENGILEYVKSDVKICECCDKSLQICDCGKKIKCVNCNNIVGNILERNFIGTPKIATTRNGLGIDSIIFENI